MENNEIIQEIKNEGKSFFQAVGKTSEPVYLVLLTLYVTLFYFPLSTVPFMTRFQQYCCMITSCSVQYKRTSPSITPEEALAR